MPGVAYQSVVRGRGTSTAFTNEPTTKLTANTVYQLNTDARRLLDPGVALTVEVDADGPGAGAYVVAPASSYTVNWQFGIITFLADQGASALVRVSGSFLPVVDLLGVTSWSITQSRDVLDDTAVNNSTGNRSKRLGLEDLSGSIETTELLTVDNDTGAGVQRLQDYLDNGTPFLLEVLPGTGAKRFRGWVLLESGENGGGVADLINNTVNFTGASRAVGAGWSWEP
jgi:hypothetical protein